MPLFVVLPDVIGNAKETMRLFMRWQSIVHDDLGLPRAYVLQDGLDSVGVPWDHTEAIFIGGTTRFKLCKRVANTVAEAKDRGKWVHMGRVNTPDRAAYAWSIGCDSFDGSQFGRFPQRDFPELCSILRRESLIPAGQGVLALKEEEG